jgi:signal transduction histidine kinase
VLSNPLRTLRGRLATTYACLAVIGVATSALYTANTVRSGLHDRVVLDLADEARLVADQVSGPLARGDIVAVEEYVTRAETLTHARMLIVLPSGAVAAATPGWTTPDDGTGLSAALTGNTSVSTSSNGYWFGGLEMVRVSLPVAEANGNVVGAAEVTYSLDEVQSILSRLNATSVLVAAGAVMVAALAGFLLATSVARPADQVAQAALALANRRPTGLPFGPLSANPFPAPLPEPRGSTDEIRALVQAFNSLADQLRVHEQARREFASDVSHELHSLASAMQTAAEALDRGAAEASPALGHRLVGGLVGHTRRLVRLADDLLELARSEGGRLRVDAQDIDLTDLVRGTLDEWTPEARRRGISLLVRLPLGPLTVNGDHIRLTQALGNLIENALKYAGSGGWVRVDIGPPVNGNYEVAVTDSGPGIPPKVLPRVFERYFRVEGRASGGPGGMGLGLAIARAIVLAHGGDLVAESPPDGGARFVLRLPVPPQASSAPAPVVVPAGPFVEERPVEAAAEPALVAEARPEQMTRA